MMNYNRKSEFYSEIIKIVSNKHETLTRSIADLLYTIDNDYDAGIYYKITKVPDIRYLTKKGKQRHFLIIRPSYEMHFYLTNPAKTLKLYPFIRDKGKPKNHFQIIGRDVEQLSSADLEKLIFDSFSYIAELSIVNNNHNVFNAYTKKSSEYMSQYYPTKLDVEKAFRQINLSESSVSLTHVLCIIEENCQKEGMSMAKDWKNKIRKDIQEWFPKSR